MQYFLIFSIFILMHSLVWVSSNWQLTANANYSNALMLCIVAAIPISLLSFYGTRIGYDTLGSAWSIRLLAFGISYITFPVMTWFLLGESPFNAKTMICILLSFLIIATQLLLPNN